MPAGVSPARRLAARVPFLATDAVSARVGPATGGGAGVGGAGAGVVGSASWAPASWVRRRGRRYRGGGSAVGAPPHVRRGNRRGGSAVAAVGRRRGCWRCRRRGRTLASGRGTGPPWWAPAVSGRAVRYRCARVWCGAAVVGAGAGSWAPSSGLCLMVGVVGAGDGVPVTARIPGRGGVDVADTLLEHGDADHDPCREDRHDDGELQPGRPALPGSAEQVPVARPRTTSPIHGRHGRRPP